MNRMIKLVVAVVIMHGSTQAMEEKFVVIHDNARHAAYLQEFNQLQSAGGQALLLKFLELKIANNALLVENRAFASRVKRDSQTEENEVEALTRDVTVATDQIVAARKKYRRQVWEAGLLGAVAGGAVVATYFALRGRNSVPCDVVVEIVK